MNAGLIFSAQKYQYRVRNVAAMSGSGTNATPHGFFEGQLENSFETSPYGNTVGVYIQVEQADGGDSPASGWAVQIPAISYSNSGTYDSFASTAECIVEFDNVTIHVVPATTNSQGKGLGGSTPCFQTDFSGGTVYWQGSPVDTFGSGSIKELGLFPSFLVPAMVPVFGIGPLITASAIGSLIDIDASIPWVGSVSATLTMTAGYRWQDLGGAWHEPPIALLPPVIPPLSGNPYGSFPGLNPAFGTNTWNCGLEVYDNNDETSYTQPPDYGHYLNRIGHGQQVLASMQVVPNLPRGIRRAQPGYNALWVRTGMPKTTAYGISGWSYSFMSQDVSLDVSESGWNSDAPVIHPRQSRDLAGVRDAPDPIEDTFGFPFYCPLFCSYSQGFFENDPDNMVYIYPAAGSTTSWTVYANWAFPNVIDTLSDNPDLNPYYSSGDLLTMYWNYWGNPHWSYSLWFPGTSANPIQSDWLIDGGASSADYWELTRDQYNFQASLPPSQQTRTRTSNMLSSITETDLAPMLGQFYNGNPWIGACRFGVDKPTIPASVTPTSAGSSQWSVTDGTIEVS